MLRSVEGLGRDGPGREEAVADGEGAMDAAVAAEEEAEAAERRRGCGRGRCVGGRGRVMGDAAVMCDVAVGGLEGTVSAF